MNINGWDFADIDSPKGDEVQEMVNDTAKWTSVVVTDRDNEEAMLWPARYCTNMYYRYMKNGRYYVKFQAEQDAIMYRLVNG